MAYGNRIRSFLGVFLVASLVALIVRLFILEDYRIASPSMTPNLLTGDLVFVSKSAFNLRLPFSTYELIRFRKPRRGEIVVFSLPGRGSETYVKRVVGLEGDRLEVKQGQVFINGTVVKYRKIEGLPAEVPSRQVANTKSILQWESFPAGTEHLVRVETKNGYGPIDIPKDHFFALGDNRPDSVDSRSWGPVPFSSLKGRVTMIWLSLDSTGGLRSERIGSSIP